MQTSALPYAPVRRAYTMKMIGTLCIAGIAAFAVLQLIRPSIPASPATAEVQVPPEVLHVLQKDCYSCHSDQRRLAWFDEVVPAYWLVRHDILTAREHLDFSTLGAKPPAVQKATLFEAVNMIQLGAMPLASFKKLHPEANVTPEELNILKAYLAPWNSPPAPAPAAANPASATAAPALIALSTVQPEFSGFAFSPDFETWKILSTTDRGDNYTFRFILGNDVAIKAVQSGNITPWPDGARIAKIAWQQQTGPDGLVHTGKFIQVELMLKDARNDKDREGWGWGRWRGSDLKPYGKDAHFVTECTTCHLPVHGNDYVYTLPITAAKLSQAEIVNNDAAALPSTLPYQPLGWSAITMYVDPKTHTTATLYGNEAAMRSVHPRNPAPSAASDADYAPGSVLALVTWAQRDDPHWFGGRIPQSPQALEFVAFNASGKTYSRFAGAALTQDNSAAAITSQRTSFILGLPPAPLP